ARLPDYMVPAVFIQMEALPLTPNGKLDRRALPEPEMHAARGFEPPVGETETALARLWAEVLRRERVGRYDDFFELGGHSLLATKLILRIQQEMEVKIDLQDLFIKPTLSSLAELLIDKQFAEFAPTDLEDLAKLL